MTEMKVFVLPMDGRGYTAEFEVPDDPNGSARSFAVLRKFYDIIECSAVDVVRLATDMDMWVDDEGMFQPDNVNRFATYIAIMFGFNSQLYYGDVVITGGANKQGVTEPLSDVRLKELNNRFGPEVWTDL